MFRKLDNFIDVARIGIICLDEPNKSNRRVFLSYNSG